MAMPEYDITVGAWLREAHAEALHNLTTAKEPHEFHAAQGAYRALDQLKEQFDQVFAAEKAAIAKIKRLTPEE